MDNEEFWFGRQHSFRNLTREATFDSMEISDIVIDSMEISDIVIDSMEISDIELVRKALNGPNQYFMVYWAVQDMMELGTLHGKNSGESPCDWNK